MSGYPRPLTSIHQIEFTSRCNLRCVYCPSRNLDKPIDEGGFGRAKADMEMATYERALEWCKYFERQGTQGELSLTGLGEALLHPEFLRMCEMAREALPHNYLNLSTNGLTFTDEIATVLSKINVRVFVSTHRPEKAGPAIEIAKRHGILDASNTAFVTSSFSWAGQVDWADSAPAAPCEWLRRGWAAVLQDGRITRCCLDATGNGSFGHVGDEPGSLETSPFSLCEGCHLTVEEPVPA